jgi:hypothetical protein
VDKYKKITNEQNYDASCTLTSLPVLDLESFKHLIFVAECTKTPFNKTQCTVILLI